MQNYKNYHVPKKFQKILDCLDQQQMQDGRPLTPDEIAKKTGRNHNTVGVYLRQMLERGLVKNPSYGLYLSNSRRVGVGGGFGVLVHNLGLVFSGVNVERGLKPFYERVGDVEIRIRFGYFNKKVSVTVACNKGINYDAYLFVKKRVYDVVLDTIGVYLDHLPCEASCEFNHDFKRQRLDGIQCVTWRGFCGLMERIYNKKDEDDLRWEMGVKKTSLATVEAVLRGGLSYANVLSTQFMLIDEVKKMVEQNKFIIQAFQEQNRFIKRLLEGKQGVKAL